MLCYSNTTFAVFTNNLYNVCIDTLIFCVYKIRRRMIYIDVFDFRADTLIWVLASDLRGSSVREKPEAKFQS